MRVRAVLFVVLAALSASAQRVQEQITVDLVEVPVHVTRRGKAVTGLTKEQFELFVNGKRHPIEYFDVIDQRGQEPEAEAGAAPEQQMPELHRRRMIVLLFDTVNTTQHRLRRASEAAQKYVLDARPGDTLAVARLTRDGVRFILPFTNDRAAALRAVTTLRPSRAGDVFSLAMLEEERGSIVSQISPDLIDVANDLEDFRVGGLRGRATAREDGASAFGDEATDLLVAAALRYQRKVNHQFRVDEQGRLATHLGELADRLAPISGVKHVVLLTEGSGISATPHFAVKMHERFQAAGVILDAVELNGLRVSSFRPAEETATDIYSAPTAAPGTDLVDPLYTLALGTGGTVSTHGDIAEGLRLLRDLQSVTYVLSFRPPETKKSENSISVRVRGQSFGTTVTYRKGYSTTPRGDRGDGLFLADVLMNDIPQRGITVNLNVASGTAGAKVVASVPGAELLAQEITGQPLLVDVFLYVFDERDQVAAWSYWRLSLDLEKGRDFLAANPYELQKLYPLHVGRYSAKALLRFAGSDITGFQRSDFQIAAAN